jgi:hypothetical protein
MTDFMNLLDDDKLLIVHRTLARAIGLNAAIVLRQVHYWIKLHEKTKSERHFKDGRYWVYNSIRQWRDDHFEFWSTDTVKREFAALEKLGLLISANHNASGMTAQSGTRSITMLSPRSLPCGCSTVNPASPPAHARVSGSALHLKRSGMRKFAKSIGAICPNALGQSAPMDQGNLPQWIGASCPNQYQRIQHRLHQRIQIKKILALTGGRAKADRDLHHPVQSKAMNHPFMSMRQILQNRRIFPQRSGSRRR